MIWSEDQAHVLDGIQSWRSTRAEDRPQYLTVGGLAGCGKTTLVAHLIQTWRNVATAALCGKAANVLRSKGIGAQTIHSLVYIPFEDDEGRVRFKKREELDGISTICIDEASMINTWLMRDLLSFNVPVLFVGDHGQLEPIGSNPKLMANPKLRLEKIHRQAANNPILRLAMAFREGRSTPYWSDPRGRLDLRSKVGMGSLFTPDVQVICGYNKTRHEVNDLIRKKRGSARIVEQGEKLICLKNNKEFGIFNGQQMIAHEIVNESKRFLDIDVETEDGRRQVIQCLKAQFGTEVKTDYNNPNVALLDYGWCITAHKSQGSEWNDVVVIDEVARTWDARRWRYTATTRAKERLVYCA